MANIGFKKKRIFDVIMLIVILTILGIGLNIDMGIINNLPDIIQINDKMKTDIILYVFSAQVSVSTLGIALISILAGIAKDKIYGLGISQYLIEDRPLIFKHKASIIIQLILIVFSYIFMSLEGFNLLVSIFFISIIIVSMMVWDVFIIFYGNEYIRKEIYEYILNMFSQIKFKKNDKRKSILQGMKKDTLISIDISDTVTIKDNLNLFSDILVEICDNKEQKESEEILNKLHDDIENKFNTMLKDSKINKNLIILENIQNLCEKCNQNINEFYANSEEILNTFEDNMVDIFNRMLKDGDTNKSIIALESIHNLYDKCNEINKNAGHQYLTVHLNILDKVAHYIFRAMANIIASDSYDYRIIFKLEYSLYDNMYFEEVENNMIPYNNTYLNIYSGRIYYEILNKGINNYNSKRLFEVKKELYNIIEDMISYYTFKYNKKEKVKQLYLQLYQYTRVLIDNKENQILQKILFKNAKDIEYQYKEEKVEYIFIILVYLYYIIEIEYLADDELKNNCKNLIEDNKSVISYFLLTAYRFNVNNKFIEKAKLILGRWEMMPEEDAKCFIMDKAIEEFLIFFILEKNYDIEKLTNEIRVLVKDQEHYMYKNINENKSIVDKYKIFVKMFYDIDILEDEAKEKIDMLKVSIINLYKEREIKRSENDIKTKEELNDFKTKFKNICMENIENKINILHKKTLHNNIKNTMIDLLHLNTEIELMNEASIEGYINSCIDTTFTQILVKVIKENLNKVYSSKDNREILQKFFDLTKNIEVNIDTLIGYKSVFYQLQDNLVYDFREFEENKFKIRANGCNNFIIAIDSSKFYFNVKEIIVNIEKFNMDNIYSKTPINEKGEYLYEVNSDIRIPFTKSELEQYVDNTMRSVQVKMNIEYAFETDIIGVGVFINNN